MKKKAFFPPWQEIRLGTCDSARALKEKIEKAERISEWTGDMIRRTEVAGKETSVQLIKVTPRQLGFTDCPQTSELFGREHLAAYGLDLCPPEAGPQLWLAHANQPKTETVWVAMEPIDHPYDGGELRIFKLERDRRWRLSTDSAHPKRHWLPEDEFVFVRRK